jgi:aminoglycoside phosphotransferase (APT) family kinase protein
VAAAKDAIDEPRVTPWLEEHVEGLRPPLTSTLIAGGHSNLTYRLDDADGHAFVLRRPPLHHVLATAHDMGREHRIISALGPTPVPVPPALAYCDDPEVNGAPFYVMGYVEGHVLRDAAAAERLTEDQRRTAGESLVDVMAEIHAVDVDAVGLGELGRKEGYIDRQLRRWYKQFLDSKTREVPALEKVYERLRAEIPEQGPATIVHGDYRLDNCLVGDDGRIAAVLDWEICTLGDPLADVGLLMVYWTDPDDESAALLTAPTQLPGFQRRADLLQRYAERSGRDVAAIDYYTAFGYWKLACIVEGVYARYRGGAMGSEASGFEAFATQVERLAAAAEEAVTRVA